ncbi:peptide chain release factor 1, mitochondrial isoform X2 [Rhinichthys klamathensis goyatoka]|uniref:peptide chain release factor 1, mitochondrial isoform X2 n=1 Tax=Rhinichthys klamathensis goyatoka TaxID=3034132 RepID=UPI0024B48BC8|nr:peptide chain release factor 1, mitochondrial isoform X2 [Rhinichthys klamathensis goyatoka]
MIALMSAALMRILRRASPRLQTVRICRSNSHKTEDFLKSEAVQRRIKRVMDEQKSITARLERGQMTESDRRALNQTLVEASRVINAFEKTQLALRELAEIQTLIHNTSAEEQQMLELLREEHEALSRRIKQLNTKLMEALVPAEELDDRSVVLEVASGRTTGGDVCQQFTREIFDMYQGFACYKHWDFELCNYTPADYGGLHHAAARISGDSVFRWLRFEGGTHRVQRIPEVGLSSRMQRIHTGTVTVIVLPQPREVDVHIAAKDLRIDTFRSRGAGGQSVNTTDSAVRVVHLPTGTVAECQQFRSQLKNRDTALRVLRARLFQCIMGQQREQTHSARRQQVGSRCQSDRIRTYNFSQDRVTDHRIGHVTRDIKAFLRGGEDLEDLIRILQEKHDLLKLTDIS